MRTLIKILIPCIFLSGCSTLSDFFESAPKTRLAGKRIAVLERTQALDVDKDINPTPLTLPPTPNLQEWSQAGFNLIHNPQHLSLSDNPKLLWSKNLGSGQNSRIAFTSQPVVANSIVYAKDSQDILSAFDFETGDRLWRLDLAPTDEDPGEGSFGGGLAYASDKLFVTTGFGQVLALEAKTGSILWRRQLFAPARGAPTIAGGKVFVITVENETVALAVEDGHRLWHQNGVAELTSFIGSPSAAVETSSVIVPYSSGEIFSLRSDNGSVQWTDTLSAIKKTNQVSQLSDIKGVPIIDQGRVFAIGNADQLVAFDLRSGKHIWDREIGGIQTPWLAGNFLYIITTLPSLICVEALNGHIRWVHELQAFEDVKEREGTILYTGPILAGGALYVTTSTGQLMHFSPKTGDLLKEDSIGSGVTIPPIVSNNTLFIVTEDGSLLAWR